MKLHVTITDRMGHIIEAHTIVANTLSDIENQQVELYERVKSQRDVSTIYFFADWHHDNPESIKPLDGIPRFNSPRVVRRTGIKDRGLVGVL